VGSPFFAAEASKIQPDNCNLRDSPIALFYVPRRTMVKCAFDSFLESDSNAGDRRRDAASPRVEVDVKQGKREDFPRCAACLDRHGGTQSERRQLAPEFFHAEDLP
jgi:hypothetical protein